MKDITSKADVKLMVDSFYRKVNEDELLGPVFNDIAKVNWENHLPRMYTFWESLIFHTAQFRGNPFQKHIPLPIGKNHFDRWLALFNNDMRSLFDGPVAEETIRKAESIGYIFQNKLSYINSRDKVK